MLKVAYRKLYAQGGGKFRPLLCAQTGSSRSGQPCFAPRSFFGAEDFLDDDNSRPYSDRKEKPCKRPNKQGFCKQYTVAYMEPFALGVFISKRSVSASITHRVTSKQVAVAGTNSNDMTAVLRSRHNIAQNPFLKSRYNLTQNPSKLSQSLFFTFSQIHTKTSSPQPNPMIFNYLVHTLNLPKAKALDISDRFSRIKTLKKPHSVVSYFQSLGFSNAQIQSSINVCPQILFSNVENTLKPKIELFQDLGLSGSRLGEFISKNSSLLTRSLSKRLKPSIDIIRSVLYNDNVDKMNNNNDDLFRVLSRCNWLAARDGTRLLSNVSYLKSCGIMGSQLAMLLVRQPRIFALSESEIRTLVSKAVDVGFSVDSRMFVHGLLTVSSISSETFVKKMELFKKFGFSEIECMEMFKSTPGLLRTSEEKLRFGLELFLETLGLKRSVLVSRPTCLMYSMQDRVVPRYRVLQLMKSKGILKKEPRFLTLFGLSEGEFLEKYISKFPNHAEDLLVTYKGHLLGSSEEESC